MIVEHFLVIPVGGVVCCDVFMVHPCGGRCPGVDLDGCSIGGAE